MGSGISRGEVLRDVSPRGRQEDGAPAGSFHRHPCGRRETESADTGQREISRLFSDRAAHCTRLAETSVQWSVTDAHESGLAGRMSSVQTGGRASTSAFLLALEELLRVFPEHLAIVRVVHKAVSAGAFEPEAIAVPMPHLRE